MYLTNVTLRESIIISEILYNDILLIFLYDDNVSKESKKFIDFCRLILSNLFFEIWFYKNAITLSRILKLVKYDAKEVN